MVTANCTHWFYVKTFQSTFLLKVLYLCWDMQTSFSTGSPQSSVDECRIWRSCNLHITTKVCGVLKSWRQHFFSMSLKALGSIFPKVLTSTYHLKIRIGIRSIWTVFQADVSREAVFSLYKRYGVFYSNCLLDREEIYSLFKIFIFKTYPSYTNGCCFKMSAKWGANEPYKSHCEFIPAERFE